MNKKGEFTLKTFIIAMLLVAMVVSGFYVIPQEPYGFWENYDYSTTETMDEFGEGLDKNVSALISNTASDVKPKNIFTQAGNAIQSMVQGGYGVLTTISEGFGTFRNLAEGISKKLGFVSPIFVGAIISIVGFSITYAIVLIIFNRSDT